jgi:hypothetical protein
MTPSSKESHTTDPAIPSLSTATLASSFTLLREKKSKIVMQLMLRRLVV